MKEKTSFRKTLLIFVLIIIIGNLLLMLNENRKELDNQQLIISENKKILTSQWSVISEKDKALNNHQSAMSEKEKEISLLDEKIKNLEDSVDESNKELEEKYENNYYQMFYGTWQKTNNIYIENRPTDEVNSETEEDREEARKEVNYQFGYDLIYLDKNSVTFKNDLEKIKLNPIYNIYTFPYRGNFKPGNSWDSRITLDNLGLNKSEFVTCVALRYYAITKEDKDALKKQKLSYTYDKFYIKDMNTIIFSNDFCYVEYKRISEENAQDFDKDYYSA